MLYKHWMRNPCRFGDDDSVSALGGIGTRESAPTHPLITILLPGEVFAVRLLVHFLQPISSAVG